jgi:hypothetical protein
MNLPAERHEVDSALLLPVWQTAPGVPDLGVGIKETQLVHLGRRRDPNSNALRLEASRSGDFQSLS